MFDKLLNFFLWLSEITTRTHDQDLNEYRGYQRRILGWALLSLILMAAAGFIVPGDLATRPNLAGIAQVIDTASEALVIASLVALVVALWNGIALYRFMNGHGSHE